MNAILEVCEEEALGFAYLEDDVEECGERRLLANLRQLSGRERAAQQSRYARRPAPASSNSGAHCRRNKRHGL